MSDRLKKHGIRWRMNGLPIYGRGEDVDGFAEDEVVGYVSEPELPWSELTDDERAYLHKKADELLAASVERTPEDPISADTAIGWMLGEYGVSCFHRWRYVDDPRGVPFARDCPICMVSEPLPGEVYRVGDGWMRLVDRPPVLRVPRAVKPSLVRATPGDHATFEVDEYRWNGRAYEIASR